LPPARRRAGYRRLRRAGSAPGDLPAGHADQPRDRRGAAGRDRDGQPVAARRRVGDGDTPMSASTADEYRRRTSMATVVIEKNVFVPMRDEVRLATDMY